MDETRRRRDQQKGQKGERLAIDLNLASREELMQIPGVGPSMADQIIKFREKYGGAHKPIGPEGSSRESEREFDDLVNQLYI
ncbi:MAG: ComEA family DNA-binding protein [Bacillota bacterium]